MAYALKPVLILLASLAAGAPLWAQATPVADAPVHVEAAAATEAPAADGEVPETEAVPDRHPAGPFEAREIDFGAQRYRTRPLVIFADSPENLDFQRQVSILRAGLDELALRDVVVVLDTDVDVPSEWRRNLRPRGFSLVQLDKDFKPVFRKPMPWTLREITRSIDRLESRRQELLERFPGR